MKKLFITIIGILLYLTSQIIYSKEYTKFFIVDVSKELPVEFEHVMSNIYLVRFTDYESAMTYEYQYADSISIIEESDVPLTFHVKKARSGRVLDICHLIYIDIFVDGFYRTKILADCYGSTTGTYGNYILFKSSSTYLYNVNPRFTPLTYIGNGNYSVCSPNRYLMYSDFFPVIQPYKCN